MFRRLGWLVIAVAVTTSASTSAAPDGHKRVATATATAASGRAAEPALDLKRLIRLTDDPQVGNADRIDGDEARGVVAFTFDDGPNPETTPQVIDALEKYNVPATFFIVTQRIAGKHGERGREILQRELDAGFLVGSHSVTHPSLKYAVGDKLVREVDASIAALAAQAERPVGMFRPPYGSLSGAGRVRLKKLKLTEVLWSVDTLDWKAHNPDRLRKKVISMIKKDGGGVVLMHDVKPITAKIIADVLDDLEAENCARLADEREPIVPVSIHYFLKDGKAPRAVPEAVQRRTDAYKAALPDRCAKRAARDSDSIHARIESAPRHAAK
ncbi:MAG TPA: polysaccharide deacetylase family protein [Kofleriaceae bacterium]